MDTRPKRSKVLAPLPSIVDIARQAGLSPRREGRQYRVKCPVPGHPDEHPSCLLNEQKNVFWCGPCQAAGRHRGGGVVEFARLAGVSINGATATRTEAATNSTPPAPPSPSHPIERLWGRFAERDRWAESGLKRRCLEGAVSSGHIRFNVGLTGNAAIDAWAASGFRIVAQLREPDGKMVGLCLRSAKIRTKKGMKIRVHEKAKGAVFGDPFELRFARTAIVGEGLADWLVLSLLRGRSDTAVLAIHSPATMTAESMQVLFKGFKGKVYLVPHSDEAGLAGMRRVSMALREIGLPSATLPPVPKKLGGDIAALFKKKGGDIESVRLILAEMMKKARELLKQDEQSVEGEKEDEPENRICGLEPLKKHLSRSTALISRRVLALVLDEHFTSYGRRAAAQKTGSAIVDRRHAKRRKMANALMALRIDTMLRYQAGSGPPYSKQPYLRKVFGKSRQEMNDAVHWLAVHGIKRASGDRGKWGIEIPTSVEDVWANYVPVPEAAVTAALVKPFDFFVLALIAEAAEDITKARGNDARKKIIPRRYRFPLSRTELAEMIGVSAKRARASFERLHRAQLFDNDKLELTPFDGQSLLRGSDHPYELLRSPPRCDADQYARLRGEEVLSLVEEDQRGEAAINDPLFSKSSPSSSEDPCSDDNENGNRPMGQEVTVGRDPNACQRNAPQFLTLSMLGTHRYLGLSPLSSIVVNAIDLAAGLDERRDTTHDVGRPSC